MNKRPHGGGQGTGVPKAYLASPKKSKKFLRPARCVGCRHAIVRPEGLLMNDHTTIGAMLLALNAFGETCDLTWQDFEQAVNLWVEEKSHRVDTLINRAIDDVWRRLDQ